MDTLVALHKPSLVDVSVARPNVAMPLVAKMLCVDPLISIDILIAAGGTCVIGKQRIVELSLISMDIHPGINLLPSMDI